MASRAGTTRKNFYLFIYGFVRFFSFPNAGRGLVCARSLVWVSLCALSVRHCCRGNQKRTCYLFQDRQTTCRSPFPPLSANCRRCVFARDQFLPNHAFALLASLASADMQPGQRMAAAAAVLLFALCLSSTWLETEAQSPSCSGCCTFAFGSTYACCLYVAGDSEYVPSAIGTLQQSFCNCLLKTRKTLHRRYHLHGPTPFGRRARLRVERRLSLDELSKQLLLHQHSFLQFFGLCLRLDQLDALLWPSVLAQRYTGEQCHLQQSPQERLLVHPHRQLHPVLLL